MNQFKNKKRYIRKFGKAGKFDAFDGKPEGEDFLECYVDEKSYNEAIAAYEHSHEAAKSYALKCGQLQNEVEYLKREIQRLETQQKGGDL